AGCSAVALHARSAAQLYSGQADWSRIAELARTLAIPVLGNGDIQEAHDALRMMRQTGCRGVIIGRACLGRPWLFRELEALFRGEDPPGPPRFREVRACALRHARLLMDFFGPETGLRHMRRFAPWYCKSFPGAREIRGELGRVSTLAELDDLLERIPGDAAYPVEALRARRCKGGASQKVVLPPGWLDAS
ncbi:MAG: tRNA dihydrouridine synthase, partial [Planctomycetota bacterium]